MHLVYSGLGGRHDRMVVGFITTYAISAYMYHHWIWILFRKGVLDTTLCDKVRQWLAEGRWFSPCVPITSINKPDRNDVTEILLKVEISINTITITLTPT